MATLKDTEQQVLGNERINRILIVTQVVFFSCVALCLLINHGAMAENDGISFYGVYHSTIEILCVGYVVAAVGLWRIANYFKSSGSSTFSIVALRLVSIGLFALLLTPYDKGTFFNWGHMSAGVLVALLQMELSLQFVRQRPSTRAVSALMVQLAGGLLCAASLPDWHFAYLLPGEIIFQIGFAGSLLVGIRALSEPDVRVDS
jgi:hypothetical protein